MRDSTPQQLTMPEGMPVGYSLPIPVDALAIVTPVEERYDGTLVPVVKRAGVKSSGRATRWPAGGGDCPSRKRWR